jgi:hypothetical protein
MPEEESHPKVESIDESIGHEEEKEEEEENINRSALYKSLLAPHETGFRRSMPKRRMPEEETHPKVESIDDFIGHEEEKEEEEENTNPQVYSPPESFTSSTTSITPTAPTTTTPPITPTTTTPPITPITPITLNDEEQFSTTSSISDKKIRKERKEPLRRSARIAALKVQPHYKE